MEDKKFIEVWQTSLTGKEVSQKTGYKLEYVYTKASRLRGLGINLKRMGTKTQRDIIELNKIAQANG